MKKQKTCIIICGPTASGKTDIAIDVAQHFNTEIISADSRQCFKELDIAVAKPSLLQLQTVPHHFINTHHITEPFSAADYEKYALKIVTELFDKHNTVVMCGGTGLYIKAFCEGLDDFEPINENIRIEIRDEYKKQGLLWLQNCIQNEDKLYWQKGEIQNPQRLMRALEVIRGTGKSIVLQQQKLKKERDFNIVKIGIDIDRPNLYERINNRVEVMLKQGLVEEARDLFPQKNLNALQTVGYRELFDYFENNISLERAIERIKQNTRHYAKRQLTWFKKDEAVMWLKPESILEFVKNI